MTTETLTLGTIIAIAGIALFLTQHIVGFIYGAILLILGIALIAFSHEEKIEERKDLNKSRANN